MEHFILSLKRKAYMHLPRLFDPAKLKCDIHVLLEQNGHFRIAFLYLLRGYFSWPIVSYRGRKNAIVHRRMQLQSSLIHLLSGSDLKDMKLIAAESYRHWPRNQKDLCTSRLKYLCNR